MMRSLCPEKEKINQSNAITFSFTFCFALGLGKGQGSRLITTVMETSSSATRRVPSCTPLNMGLEFPGFLLRQGRFEAGEVLTWELSRKYKERLPYPRAAFIVLSASLCAQRCAGPWDRTDLEELGLKRTDLQTENDSAPGSPGLTWALLERTGPEPTLRGSWQEGVGVCCSGSLAHLPSYLDPPAGVFPARCL